MLFFFVQNLIKLFDSIPFPLFSGLATLQIHTSAQSAIIAKFFYTSSSLPRHKRQKKRDRTFILSLFNKKPGYRKLILLLVLLVLLLLVLLLVPLLLVLQVLLLVPLLLVLQVLRQVLQQVLQLFLRSQRNQLSSKERGK